MMGSKKTDSDDRCSEALSSAQEEKLAEQQICRESMEEKNRQISEYLDQIVRLKAEFENYRKRVEREKAEYLAWGKQDILQRLIMLQDVLEQAQRQAGSTQNIESIKQGLSLINREFEKFLVTEGVDPAKTKDAMFDPHLHEAVEYVETGSGRDGEILEELQKGYSFNKRVIRPARVRVVRAATEKVESKEPGNASNKKEEAPPAKDEGQGRGKVDSE